MQEEIEMEWVDAVALKTNFRAEMVAVKSTQQAFSDEVFCGGSEEFFVDDLLDFSNEDVQGFMKREEEDEEEKGDDTQLVVSEENSNSSIISVKNDFMTVSNSELGVPADDLENLEWLSHFVEDSFKSDCFLYNKENATYKTQNENISVTSSLSTRNGLAMGTQVPAKARSKRPRTGSSKVWTFGGPPFTESSSTPSPSSSSSSSPSPSFSSSSSCLIFADTGLIQDPFYCLVKSPYKKKHKKKVKKPELESPPQRRCSHCLVTKTPQWRTGPLGSKTLCNACGVRYKSGRLFPEYRPAGSPTFSTDRHSNSHRKVLEMRRKKEELS